MKRIDTELRRKFVKESSLPIQVLESPYFEYFLDLYEPTLGSKTSWTSLQKEISEKFSEKPGKYLEYSRGIQEKITNDILENSDYKRFCKDENLNKIISETPGQIKKDIYTGSNQGKRFLSIDLRTANFQALHWYCPEIFSGKDTWEDFIKEYTSSQFMINSKYLRQVILGKTNQGRISGVEKYLTWRITELVSPLLSEFTLISRMTDEAIWEIPEKFNPTGEIEEKLKDIIKENLGIQVNIEVFTINLIQRFTNTGESVLGFIKDFAWPLKKPSKLKATSKTWYPQIYKAWKGLDLNPIFDLVLLHEGELARFDYPLSIINPRNEKEND